MTIQQVELTYTRLLQKAEPKSDDNLQSLVAQQPVPYSPRVQDITLQLPDWEQVKGELDQVEKPPFGAPDREVYKRDLHAFFDRHPFYTQVDARRGMPLYLEGMLREPAPGALSAKTAAEIATGFVHDNLNILSGLEASQVNLRLERQIEWPVEGGAAGSSHLVSYIQTNAEGIALFGSQVSCNLEASGALNLVQTTLLPAQPAQIDADQNAEMCWERPGWLLQDAQSGLIASLHGLPENLIEILGGWLYFAEWPAAQPALQSDPSQKTAAVDLEKEYLEQVIFPTQNAGSQQVEYRPAWLLVVVNALGKRWQVLVDAARHTFLYATPAFAEMQAQVYLRWVINPVNLPQPVIAGVDLLASSNVSLIHLANTNRIRLSGPRVMEPSGAVGQNLNQVLSATAYYHIYRAQERFTALLAGSGLGAASQAPNPTGHMDVLLTDQIDNPEYVMMTKVTPDPYVLMPAGAPEPGLDPEVYYHEFSHAISEFVNRPALRFQSLVGGLSGLQEGLAYYLAVWLSASNSMWGEGAYGFAAERDLANQQRALTGNNQPVDAHAMGLRWARVFWDLRSRLANNPVDSLSLWLLKAVATLPCDTTIAFSAKTFGAALRSQTTINSPAYLAITAAFSSAG
jgi:hypothetical protein